MPGKRDEIECILPESLVRNAYSAHCPYYVRVGLAGVRGEGIRYHGNPSCPLEGMVHHEYTWTSPMKART